MIFEIAITNVISFITSTASTLSTLMVAANVSLLDVLCGTIVISGVLTLIPSLFNYRDD